MSTAGMRWAERLFTGLIYTYPAPFRDEYGEEMRAAFRARMSEEAQSGRWIRLAALWVSIVVDTFSTAAGQHLDQIARDARDGVRALLRREARPSAAAAVLTLALGVASATTIFGVAHAVILAPLPYHEPSQVVRVWDTNASLDIQRFSSSVPNFVDWQERTRSFTGLAAFRSVDVNLVGNGESERVAGLAASASLWTLLGIRPVAGRTFSRDEDRPGGAAVALISEGLWQRRFGGDLGVLGRVQLANGTPHTIIGVVPQDVGFTREIDVWLPLGPDPARESRGDRQLTVIGRLAPGVVASQADEEMDRIAAAIEREQPSRDTGWRVRVAPIREWLVSEAVRDRLVLLLAAVALLLLVACINVAGLQLARGFARAHELATRVALGASRRRLVRQLVTESALLAAAGGVCGIALAGAVIGILPGVLPASVPRGELVALSPPVLFTSIGLTATAILLFGVLPALLVSRIDPHRALRGSGRSLVSGRGTRVQRTLVAAQVALAMVLTIGAALLVQSFARLQDVRPGFDADRVLTARVHRPVSWEHHASALAFYDRMLDGVRALPGVRAAGIGSAVPFGGNNTSMSIGPIPRPAHIPELGIQVSWRTISDGYLEALGVPLLRGRLFDEAHDPEDPIVISASLAARLWPDEEDPIGRRVFISSGSTCTVIGVVGDVHQRNLGDAPTPTMYFSSRGFLWPTMTLAVGTIGDPASLAGMVHQAVKRADPAQPLFEVRPLRALVSESAAEPRLHTILLGAFAALALLLALVGVAGVVANAVARRGRELAVRLALGASTGRVVREIAGQGLALTFAGAVGGLALAALFARLLSGVLFGVSPREPAVYATAAVVVLVAAGVACWLPARRAARIDPMIALRGE